MSNTKTRSTKYIIILSIVTVISYTHAQTTSTNVLDWINALNSPGSAPCPTEMRSTLNQCYVRNNSEAENIQPLCEHLIMKSSVSSNRSTKVCASLAGTCKAPAVITFNKAISPGLITYHISCQMFDASVLASAYDGVTYGLSCRYTTSGIEYYGTQDKTASGATCQRWDAGLGHFEAINFASTFFAENITNLSQLGNKCRNYIVNAGFPLGARRAAPWCYNSTSWELCNVPLCADAAATRSCKRSHHGIDYNGNVAKTNTNVTCSQWSWHSNLVADELFVDGSGAAAGNKCRNVIANDKGVSCFIYLLVNGLQSPVLTTCDVPDC